MLLLDVADGPILPRPNKKPLTEGLGCLAERVGFEPTKGYKPLPVFKTGAFNRSATSPCQIQRLRIVLAVSGGFNPFCYGSLIIA